MISISNLTKIYKQAGESVKILNNFNFNVARAEIVSVVGSSGCGKTTLLQIIGMIDGFDSGVYSFDGIDVSKMTEVEKNNCIKNEIGFIYQAYNLLSDFTALENVMLPLLIKQESLKTARIEALEMLNKVGLVKQANYKPNQLSGGQQQRVGIARVLVKKPKLILADEPTGNLDPETAHKIADLLVETARDCRSTLIMVTHNSQLALKTDWCLRLEASL